MTPSDLLHRPYSTPSLFYKCRKKLHWDDIIPEDITRRWQAWLQELPKQVATDRSFKPPNLGEVTSTQLHHFSDVSHQGYAAVTYLRFTDCSGNTKCSFVMGKSRLEPMKSVTVPRMELSAAVVATTLETMSCEELSLPISELFSGLTAPALHWKSRQTTSNICGKSNRNHSWSIFSGLVAIGKHSVKSSGRRVKGCVSRFSSSLDSWPRIPDSANW